MAPTPSYLSVRHPACPQHQQHPISFHRLPAHVRYLAWPTVHYRGNIPSCPKWKHPHLNQSVSSLSFHRFNRSSLLHITPNSSSFPLLFSLLPRFTLILHPVLLACDQTPACVPPPDKPNLGAAVLTLRGPWLSHLSCSSVDGQTCRPVKHV